MSNAENIISFDYDDEIRLFNERNPELMRLFPMLNEAIDQTLVQVKHQTSDRVAVSVHMLVRLATRHCEALLHLAMCGHGFSAVRTLRSMFEKTVDAAYLSKNLNEIEDFWDYGLFALQERGVEMPVSEEEFAERTKRFFGPKGGRRPRWSTLSTDQKAESVGVGTMRFHGYKLANPFIHSSALEIVDSFYTEADNTISPASGSTETERRWADMAAMAGVSIMAVGLETLVDHFKLKKPAAFDLFYNPYIEHLKEVGRQRHESPSTSNLSQKAR